MHCEEPILRSSYAIRPGPRGASACRKKVATAVCTPPPVKVEIPQQPTKNYQEHDHDESSNKVHSVDALDESHLRGDLCAYIDALQARLSSLRRIYATSNPTNVGLAPCEERLLDLCQRCRRLEADLIEEHNRFAREHGGVYPLCDDASPTGSVVGLYRGRLFSMLHHAQTALEGAAVESERCFLQHFAPASLVAIRDDVEHIPSGFMGGYGNGNRFGLACVPNGSHEPTTSMADDCRFLDVFEKVMQALVNSVTTFQRDVQRGNMDLLRMMEQATHLHPLRYRDATSGELHEHTMGTFRETFFPASCADGPDDMPPLPKAMPSELKTYWSVVKEVHDKLAREYFTRTAFAHEQLSVEEHNKTTSPPPPPHASSRRERSPTPPAPRRPSVADGDDEYRPPRLCVARQQQQQQQQRGNAAALPVLVTSEISLESRQQRRTGKWQHPPQHMEAH